VTTAPANYEPADLSTLLDTIAQADAGNPLALERMRDMFRDTPDLASSISGLAWNAETAILAGVPAGVQELFRQQTTNLRKQLREEGTGTVLESMLIRRIGLDFIASLQAERARSLEPGESRSLELSRFYEQQADRAHRRFLASVESLARVRKLIVPLQINIAEQQVNMAGNVRTGTGAGYPPGSS